MHTGTCQVSLTATKCQLFLIVLVGLITLQAVAGNHNLTITIQFDNNPDETGLYLYNATNMHNYEIIWQLNGSTEISNTKRSFTIEIDSNNKNEGADDKCWLLYLNDSVGNGICCDNGCGYFSLHLNNKVITLGNQTFFGNETEFYWCNSFFDQDIENNDCNYRETCCDYSLTLLFGGAIDFDMDIKRIANEEDYWYIDWINLNEGHVGDGYGYDEDGWENIVNNYSNITSIGEMVYFNEYQDWKEDSNNSLCISDGCYVVKIDPIFGSYSWYSLTLQLNEIVLFENQSMVTGLEFGFCTSHNYTDWSLNTYTSTKSASDGDVGIEMQLIFSPDEWSASNYMSGVSWKLIDLSNGLIVAQNNDTSNSVYYSDFQTTITTYINDSGVNSNTCFLFELYDYWFQLDTFKMVLNQQTVSFGNEIMSLRVKSMSFCVKNFLDNEQHVLNISMSNVAIAATIESVTIENITLYEKNGDPTDIDIIYRNHIMFSSGTKEDMALFITDGCYRVTVNSVRAFVDASGECIVFVDDQIVGYCYKGVKSETDTSVIFCTNDNHISHCIVPHFCNGDSSDISDIYLSEYEIKQYDGEMLTFESTHALGNMVNQSIPQYVNCLGELSCYNTSFQTESEEFLGNIFCFALRACTNVSSDVVSSVYLFCNSMFACDSIEDAKYVEVHAVYGLSNELILRAALGISTTFGLSNTRVMMHNGDSFFLLSAYFAMFNVTVACTPNVESGVLKLYCNYNQLFVVLDQSCYNGNWSIELYQCDNLVNNINDVDHEIWNLAQTVTAMTSTMEAVITKCHNNDGINNTVDLVYNIGHSVYFDQDVINSYQDGNICCRGAYSCGGTSILSTMNGSILCGGYKSCKDVDFLWTQANISHVYCVSVQACEASAISSSGDVICGGFFACWKSVIFNAVNIFCLAYESCSNLNVRQFDKMYILGFQQDITVYSGNSENAHVEIWFYDTRTSSITFYCESSDACTIHCDEYSCGNLILYCDGLCDIQCSFDNAYACNVPVYSASPTVSPTENQVLLTEEDVSNGFNWVIGCTGGLTLIILIAGYVHAFKYHNQLFDVSIVLVAILYSNDFISDVFFVLRLSVLAFDGFEENQNRFEPFLILFILSLTFVMVPFYFNLYQLHCAISKWASDKMLKESCVSHWLALNARKLYFMAIITGSSFSAIDLSNSYLFKLNVFSMGLSDFHRSQFRTKRFYSVVLLEVELYFCKYMYIINVACGNCFALYMLLYFVCEKNSECTTIWTAIGSFNSNIARCRWK